MVCACVLQQIRHSVPHDKLTDVVTPILNKRLLKRPIYVCGVANPK
jgi:hypothetical protein